MRRLLVAIVVGTIVVATTMGHLFSQPVSSRSMPVKATFFSSGDQKSLELAVRADDPNAIDRLLSAGAHVDARGLQNVTPLMIAVNAQAASAVEALLRAGAKPNLKADDGAGPVHLAVEAHAERPHGHAILEMIMRAGGDPNTVRPDDDPVIVQFTYDHDLDDLRWFASLGANLDQRGRSGRPMISDIAFSQNWDSAWVMIELGARYDYEGTGNAVSGALDSPYGSSPDGEMYAYKRKFWQLFTDRGLTTKPWREPVK